MGGSGSGSVPYRTGSEEAQKLNGSGSRTLLLIISHQIGRALEYGTELSRIIFAKQKWKKNHISTQKENTTFLHFPLLTSAFLHHFFILLVIFPIFPTCRSYWAARSWWRWGWRSCWPAIPPSPPPQGTLLNFKKIPSGRFVDPSDLQTHSHPYSFVGLLDPKTHSGLFIAQHFWHKVTKKKF